MAFDSLLWRSLGLWREHFLCGDGDRGQRESARGNPPMKPSYEEEQRSRTTPRKWGREILKHFLKNGVDYLLIYFRTACETNTLKIGVMLLKFHFCYFKISAVMNSEEIFE